MGKKLAMIFGWILVVLGLLGFVSNPVVGSTGIFMTDLMHNIVHLLIGAILLWAVYGMPGKVMMALKTFGVIFLILALWGFVSSGSVLGMMMNSADNWLHLVLGVVFCWGGWMGGKSMSMPAQAPMGGQPGM